MTVELNFTESGNSVGDILPGWSVEESATPIAIGDSSGGVGGVRLTVLHDEDSEFVVDNFSEFSHDELGTIAGKILSLTSQGATEATDTVLPLQQTTPLSKLTAERTANVVDDTGLTMQAAGIFGYIDANPNVESYFNYKYPLGDGADLLFLTMNTTTGFTEINRVDGNGVRSIVTVSAITQNNVMGFAYDAGSNQFYLAHMAAGVPRISRISSAGAVVNSWGSVGSGNSQWSASGFTTGYGNPIAWTASRLFAIGYYEDRVQYFTSAGTYQGQWATTDPVAISHRLPYNNVLVQTATGTVRSFSTTGVLEGTYTIPRSGVTGAGVVPRSDGGMIVLSNKTVGGYIGYIDVWDGLNLWSTLSLPGSSYEYPAFNDTYFYATNGLTPGDSVVPINQFIGTTTLRGLFSYYLSLLDIDSYSYLATDDPAIIAPPWTDSVWNKLKELASAYGVEIYVVDGVITVSDIGARTLDISNVEAGSASLQLNTQSAALSVNITNYNTTSGYGVMYSAAVDNKMFSVGTGGAVSATVSSTNYPSILGAFAPADTPVLYGTYKITDSLGAVIPANRWTTAGGLVEVSIGDKPGTLNVEITGPTYDPVISNPGDPLLVGTGPYTLSSDKVTPFFIVMGYGVFTSPQTISLLTGGDSSKVSTLVARDINNIFINDLERLYDRGIWFTLGASGPEIVLTATVPTNMLDSFGLTAGSIVLYKEGYYRVYSVDISNATAKIWASPYTTTGDVDALMTTKTTGDFDAFWGSRASKDFKIKPLRPII